MGVPHLRRVFSRLRWVQRQPTLATIKPSRRWGTRTCGTLEERSVVLRWRGEAVAKVDPMLLELRAENYAVIDATVAEFGPGLNLLTGETGAGKSILIDALALLLGGKASSDLVRHGADKAVLSCVFETTPGAEKVLEENGVDAAEEGIVLRREVATNGKGRVFINNQPATVGALRQLAPELALVHAQSETLTAFDATQQRLLLDRAAQIGTEAVAVAFARWRDLRAELAELNSAESDRLRQMDLWSFQAREIEAAGDGGCRRGYAAGG